MALHRFQAIHVSKLTLFLSLIAGSCWQAVGQDKDVRWNQWRGSNRDAQVAGVQWPEGLSEKHLTQVWRVELGESYSGPIVSDAAVFTTATEGKTEAVYAFSRDAGKQIWKASWEGSLSVPFFAASNGSWIRSTPAFDGKSLFVAGMRDRLVAINAETGQEQWHVDFIQELNAPPPAFGCVCSPLLDGDDLYMQAGASVVKVDKNNGKIRWRALQDAGGMSGSAFSSPILATVAGQKQLVVQTREKLAGIHPDDGRVLWEHVVPSFRGMNILTPIVYGDSVFTSSYQHNSWLFRAAKLDDAIKIEEAWSNNAQGYMSTPVVIGDHVYMHLQNQRFTCIDLKTGERTWTSQPYGKYCSLVAQGDRILALDQRGTLLLLKANPKEFQLLDERQIADQETWAHLAVSDSQIFVRELKALTVFKWQ